MLDLQASRTAIAREIESSIAMLEAEPDRWDEPTRLTGWNVSQLAAHLVYGQRLQAAAWRNLLEGRAEVAAAAPPSTDERDGVLAQLHDAAAGLAGALALVPESALGSAIAMPYGSLPAMAVLQTAVLEAGVHRSDLAAALGADDRLAADVVVATSAMVGLMLPVLASTTDVEPPEGTTFRLEAPAWVLEVSYGGGAWQAGAGDGPTVTIAGDDTDVLLFTLGRRSLDGSSLRAVEGDSALAGQFKSFFPGP